MGNEKWARKVTIKFYNGIEVIFGDKIVNLADFNDKILNLADF